MKIIGYAVINNVTNEIEGKLYRRHGDAENARWNMVGYDPSDEFADDRWRRAKETFRIAPLIEMS